MAEGDIRALGGECRRDGRADAATTTRDEGFPVLKPSCHVQPFISSRQRLLTPESEFGLPRRQRQKTDSTSALRDKREGFNAQARHRAR
jgi:hypothetical protein